MTVNTRFTLPRLCRKARYVGANSWVCECPGKCQRKGVNTLTPPATLNRSRGHKHKGTR